MSSTTKSASLEERTALELLSLLVRALNLLNATLSLDTLPYLIPYARDSKQDVWYILQ